MCTETTNAVVNWPKQPAAVDNCDGPINETTCSNGIKPVVSGGTYSVGVTTVNCTATDAAGNQGNCAWDVEVYGMPKRVKLPFSHDERMCHELVGMPA